jgi:hypothetical protein
MHQQNVKFASNGINTAVQAHNATHTNNIWSVNLDIKLMETSNRKKFEKDKLQKG